MRKMSHEASSISSNQILPDNAANTNFRTRSHTFMPWSSQYSLSEARKSERRDTHKDIEAHAEKRQLVGCGCVRRMLYPAITLYNACNLKLKLKPPTRTQYTRPWCTQHPGRGVIATNKIPLRRPTSLPCAHTPVQCSRFAT